MIGMPINPVVVQGVQYRSKKAACEAYGIPVSTVSNRMMHLGLSLEEAILFTSHSSDSKVSGINVQAKRVICDGVEYESLRSFARTIGASLSHVSALYNSGVAPEEIADKYKTGKVIKTGTLIVCGGRKYWSVMDFANYLGAEYLTVHALLRSGLSPEDIEQRYALKKKYGVRRISSIVSVNGVLYPSKEAACRDNGVSVHSVKHYITRGLTLEEAINSVREQANFTKNVKSYRKLCGGRYYLVECAVCRRTVMLPTEKAKLFEHSDLCEKCEWME